MRVLFLSPNTLRKRKPVLLNLCLSCWLVLGFSLVRGQEPRLQMQLGHTLRVKQVVWNPDGKTLATGGSDGLIKLWEAESGRLLNTFAGSVRHVDSLAWRPDGKTLASSGLGKIEVWNAESGRIVKTFDVGGPQSTAVAWSPDGTKLAYVQGETLTIWLANEDRTLLSFRASAPIAWSPDGQTLASTDRINRDLVLHDSVSGKQKSLVTGSSLITDIAWRPRSNTLAWGDLDRTIRIWQTDSSGEIRQIKGHSKYIRSLSWSPNGELLASTGGNVIGESEHEAIKVWESQTGQPHIVYKEAFSTSWVIAWSPSGQWLASGDDDGVVRLWDAEKGNLLANLTGRGNPPWIVSWSPDGRMLAVEDQSNFVDEKLPREAVRLWDLRKGRLRSSFTGAFAWSKGGELLAVSSPYEPTVKLLEIETGELRSTLGGHSGPVPFLTFSPDGQTLATWSRDSAIRLWNSKDGRLRFTVPGQFNSRDSLLWSPESTRFVSVDSNGHTKLWDTATGSLRKKLSDNAVVAWSPTGEMLATVGPYNTVRLWNGRTGTALGLLRGRIGELSSLAWSPDGRKLLALNEDRDGGMAIWEIQTKRLRTVSMYSPMLATWSANGKFIILEDGISGVELRDGQTGRLIKPIRGIHTNPGFLGWSPSGNLLAVPDENHLWSLWDLDQGRRLATYESSSEVATLDFDPTGKLLATCNKAGDCTLWDVSPRTALKTQDTVEPRDGDSDLEPARRICTLVIIDDDLVVVRPDGRFDTSNLEITQNLFWILPDEPFRTLPIEIFMQQTYTPLLLRRSFAGEHFDKLPSLTELNRVPPRIEKITVVPRDDQSGLVDVKIKVSSVAGQCAQGGQRVPCESGVYDLRLYRDNQLVRQYPQATASAPAVRSAAQDSHQQLEQWRRDNVVKNSDDQPITVATGPQEITITDVQLPRAPEVSQVQFTAYAFNQSRVKSPTSEPVTYPLSAGRPERKRRGYLIAVGVDVTTAPTWRLSYAPNSARQVAKLFAEQLGSYELVNVNLISEYAEKGKEVPHGAATKGNIETVLRLLSTKGGTAAQHQSFKMLETATPDDFVLVYIASHGYADPQGNFYIIPSDIGQPVGVSEKLLNRCLSTNEESKSCRDAREFLRHSISSDNLAQWLQTIDAGEIVLILDSCHSAAVSGPAFRPGPMGDSGFGQLSYDKGMLVLAATQAEDVAWGTLALNDRSLLTQALTLQKNENGRLGNVQQWLSAAQKLVPKLYRQYVANNQQEQEPELFDFIKRRAAVTPR